MTVELIENGARRLAVSVGRTTGGRALTRVLGLKGSPGWIVADGGAREWRFEEVLERDGETFLCGPAFSGRSLEEVAKLPLAEAVPYLLRLARALRAVEKTAGALFPLETDAVVFGEADVLFLPPALFAEIRDLRPFEINSGTYECINHPDLRDEQRAVFSISALLYRVITGRFPFAGAQAEEMHEEARKREIPAPDRLVPELLPEVSALVMTGLGRVRGESLPLAQAEEKLASWQGKELTRALEAGEKETILRETAAQENDAARSYRRRVFWEKNWKVVAIVAVVVIAVGAVLGSVLKNALKPRVTHGYPAEKVVTTFYASMNELDHMTMQDCVVGKAGKGEINEATTLFVTSKVTQGYEGKSHVTSAAAWDKAGRPPLTSPDTLFGVTGLSVTAEQGEPQPIYRVVYDMWNPAPAPDTETDTGTDTTPLSEGHHVTDRVWLKLDNGDWVIYRIDRIQADLLPAPAVTAAPTAQTGQRFMPQP